MNISGKVVLLTGASEWIGEQIALRLAKEGARLALVARNLEKLSEVAKQAENAWAKEVRVYSQDLSKTEELSSLVEQITADFWGVDILINNAWSWMKMWLIDEIDASKIDSVVATNLSWVIHITQNTLKYLKKSEEAAIINISSKAWVVPQKWMSIYSATKYGMRGFTDVLKEDLKDTNVRVAGVYQAWIKTSMLANWGETASMPIEKFSDPADLADIICFMLSQPPKIWMHDVRICF